MSTRRLYESRMTARLLVLGRDLDEIITRLYLENLFLPEECDELAGVLYAKELLTWECLYCLVESGEADWARWKAILEARSDDLQSVLKRVRTELGAEQLGFEQIEAGARFAGAAGPRILQA